MNAAEPLGTLMRAVDLAARQARLLVCIPFAFREHRFGPLFDMLRLLAELPVAYVQAVLVTNTRDPDKLGVLEPLLDLLRTDDRTFRIDGHVDLDHPFALPWLTKPIITREFLGSDFTHCLYLEDDARFTYQNLCYFMAAREVLRPHGLIPSFVRYEWSKDQLYIFSTDHPYQADIDYLPHLEGGDVFYTTLNSVFNATIVLDHELAAEYVQTRSFDRVRSEEVFGWEICERAAMGLAWENVPEGHLSRYVIPIRKDRLMPATPCLIHHLVNNYTDGWFGRTHHPDVKLGRLRIDKLFYKNGDPGIDPDRA